MLEYKTRFEGKMFEKVNPRNTSRKCNICGFISKENRVSQSEFKCLKCDHTDHADSNASKNIKDLGIETYLKAA
jgi:putative transposase